MAAEHAKKDEQAPPFRWLLLLGTVTALCIGLAAGLSAGEATLLRSNVVFRFAVGAVVAVVVYLAVVAVWLAAQGKTFRRLGLFGANAEPGDDTAAEISQRDREVAEFMGTTTKAVEELERRVEALERPRT